MYLTNEALREWKRNYAQILLPNGPVTIDGVCFSEFYSGIRFRYGNATGLIFADNGYLGQQLDGKNYYPMVRLSARYSDECKFNPTCEPELQSIAAAVKDSWRKFTTNG